MFSNSFSPREETDDRIKGLDQVYKQHINEISGERYTQVDARNQKVPMRHGDTAEVFHHKIQPSITKDEATGVWNRKRINGTTTPILTVENVAAAFVIFHDNEKGPRNKRELARKFSSQYDGVNQRDIEFLVGAIEKIDSEFEKQFGGNKDLGSSGEIT